MTNRAYEYSGPLEPGTSKHFLVPRTNDLNRVINGLKKGDYWAIFGARQIGKTTFLRQLKMHYPDAIHIYFDFEMSPMVEKHFFQSIKDELLKQIPGSGVQAPVNDWHEEPHLEFIWFLEHLQTNFDRDKKIVLQFDEIEALPFADRFLQLWRKICHIRIGKENLEQYAVILTSSAKLRKKNDHSPLHFAKYLFMNDFSPAEAESLITDTFSLLDIHIVTSAREKLLELIGGHPQMLQHACALLVETAKNENRAINEADIDNTVYMMLVRNASIQTLKEDLKEPKLQRLAKKIFQGKPPKFYLYDNFFLTGAGCIVEGENQCCAFRNPIYAKVVRDLMDISSQTGSTKNKEEMVQATNTCWCPLYLESDQEARYRKMQFVGGGGMATVIKAKDEKLQRIVALKLFKRSYFRRLKDIDHFYKEAQTAGRLSHPNIVTIYDCGRLGEDFFISMEYVEGLSLNKLLANNPPLAFQEIFYLIKQALNGLEYAHRSGVIHRDIKPGNIIVSREGDIKIVDFGLAALRVLGQTGDTGIVQGTPSYMSPEQIMGKRTDRRTDFYSLGITLFQAITGILPFRDKKIDELYLKHLEESPPSLQQFRSDLPPGLDYILKKCLAKEPDQRFDDAKSFAHALEDLIANPVKESDIKIRIKARLPENKDNCIRKEIMPDFKKI